MVKRSNLLLVEDDTSVRDALTKVLTGENYAVHGAASGREAVDAFSRNRIEVVVLDLNLGEEDGWTIFEALKQLSPELPIIVTSAHGHRLAHSSASRANGVLEKPFDLGILLGLLRQASEVLSPVRETRRPSSVALCVMAAILGLSIGSAQAVNPPFRMSPLTVNNGAAVIQWTGGGSLNLVQTTTELNSGNWMDVDGPTTAHSVSAICTEPNAFFRVMAFSNTTGDTTPPSVPTGLVASLTSPTEAALSWNPSSDFGTGLKGYNVYRDGIFLKQVSTPYAQDNDLVPSGQYSYQVCAVDWARNLSAKSSPVPANPTLGGCAYSIAPTTASLYSVGGSGSITVTAGPGCNWTATSGASWITVTSGAAGTGDGTVNYLVSANGSTSSRTGSLTIGDETFWVTQGGLGGADTTPPTAAFQDPSSGTVLTGSTTLRAVVSDGGGVGTVEFYVDNNGVLELIGSERGSGTVFTSSVVYNTANVLNGQHTFYVKSFDLAGNSSWAWVTVTVSNYNADPGTLIWAKDVGASPLSGEAHNMAVKTDSQGNQIVVGKFMGSINFSGTTLTGAGSFDLFVAKFWADGRLAWVRGFGGIYDNIATSVAVDGADNILVTGYFVGTMELGGGLLISGGGNNNPDVFVAKFSSAGAHIWSKRVGGSYGNFGYGIGVDRNNDVFVTGQYSVQADFGGGPLQSAGGGDGFLAKFSGQNGAYLWARSFGGTGADYPQGLGMDPSGDVLVTGYSTGSMDFGGGLRANAGGSDAFLAKFSGATGGHVWSKMVGGSGNEQASALSFDPSGNAVLAGSFTGTLNLGGISLAAPLTTAMFVAKYSPTGSVIWAFKVGGSSSVAGSVGPRAAAVDSSGNVVVTGNATGEADFGNGSITGGTGNIFLAKYSADGSYLWSKRFVSTGWSTGMGLAIDQSRNIIAAGSFSGTVTFDTVQLNSASIQTRDAYLVKFTP